MIGQIIISTVAKLKPRKEITPQPDWAWSEPDYMAFIAGPDSFDDQRRFFNGIKQWGFNPPNVRMTSPEYKYWAKRAIKDATSWVAEYDTPEPADFNGMQQ